MAKAFQGFLTILILLTIVSTIQEVQTFSTQMSPNTLNLKEEKLTHLHFYFHDIINGQNISTVQIAAADVTRNSSTHFGALLMMDDALTESPELTSSGIIGHAQGIYGSASHTEIALLMAFNFVISKGEYSGSSLSVLGSNRIFSGVRELPILGGSGRFRFARGYALAKTYELNLTTLNAIVEYNVYVLHY